MSLRVTMMKLLLRLLRLGPLTEISALRRTWDRVRRLLPGLVESSVGLRYRRYRVGVCQRLGVDQRGSG
jgi:hypothetical protein